VSKCCKDNQCQECLLAQKEMSNFWLSKIKKIFFSTFI